MVFTAWVYPFGYWNLHGTVHLIYIEFEVDDTSNRHIQGLLEDPMTISTPLNVKSWTRPCGRHMQANCVLLDCMDRWTRTRQLKGKQMK